MSVAASWGFGFVWMKDAIERQPYFDFLALRFTIAAGVMFLIRPQLVRHINLNFLNRGALLGLALGLGYVTQTIGLEQSTAAITGFFTGLYIVLTPLFAWLLLRQKIAGRNHRNRRSRCDHPWRPRLRHRNHQPAGLRDSVRTAHCWARSLEPRA
jgi:drug/metabolite transporter (DMT)-like permease